MSGYLGASQGGGCELVSKSAEALKAPYLGVSSNISFNKYERDSEGNTQYPTFSE